MYFNEGGRTHGRPELPRRRLQLRATLSLAETGSFQVRNQRGIKASSKLQALGLPRSLSRQGTREAGHPGAAARGGGDLTWGTRRPPPAPGLLCSRTRRARALRLQRAIQRRNFGRETRLRKVFGAREREGKSDWPAAGRGGLTSGTTGQDLARSLFHEAGVGLDGHLRKPGTTEWAEQSRRARRPQCGPVEIALIEREPALGRSLRRVAPCKAAIRPLLGGGGSERRLAA